MNEADQSPPTDYQKLFDLFERFREKFELLDAESEENLDFLKCKLDSGRWAFDPDVKSLLPADIDRLGEITMGPLYTSAEYPWPVSDGAPMAPLIQLNLNNVRELGGVSLGDGLFQAWIPKDAVPWKDGFQFRVIPAASVRIELLTEIPAFDYSHKYFQPVDWAFDEYHRKLNDNGLSYQMNGWKKRYTTQLDVEGFKHFKSMLKKNLLDEDLKNILKDFDVILKNSISEWSPSSNHLLGTFDVVQYTWDEKPLPLFCFEGEGELGAYWGDGSAQLFYYKLPDGAVRFSFDWSCC